MMAVVDKVFRNVLLKNRLCVTLLRNFSSGNAVCVNESQGKQSILLADSFRLRQLDHYRHVTSSRYLNDQSSTNTLNSFNDRIEVDPSDGYSEELDPKFAQYSELAVDVEKKKKIVMILMEHEVAKLEGRRVPSKLNVEEMGALLNLFSFSARVRYLGFLYAKETVKETNKRKKEIKRKEREVWQLEKPNIKRSDHLTYGIGNNTMLVRVRRKSMMSFYNQRLANAVLHGQKLVVDMDYDCFMRMQDCTNCSEQLMEGYSVNRKASIPYDLYFCNAHHTSSSMRTFRKFMPNLYSPDNFITVTDMSYLDIFPKEKLVYITPSAKEPMRTYDHDAIYIIGGLVDKCIREPVVMAKAKREGVKALHIPYEDHLMWGRGSKSLPLNQVIGILLEMKRTQDWNQAFRMVPQRKLVRSLDLFSDF